MATLEELEQRIEKLEQIVREQVRQEINPPNVYAMYDCHAFRKFGVIGQITPEQAMKGWIGYCQAGGHEIYGCPDLCPVTITEKGTNRELRRIGPMVFWHEVKGDPWNHPSVREWLEKVGNDPDINEIGFMESLPDGS